MSFLSEAEIVEDILRKLSEEDRNYIRANRKEIEAVYFDGSFGRWIRNQYNLWDEANPHTMLNYVPQMEKWSDPDFPNVVIEGDTECDMNPKHPDNFSGNIRKEVYRRIRAQ